jgi:predicted dehydrogenase
MTSDRVNLGMVGLGGWGKNVAASFTSTPHCHVSYICDASAQTLTRQVSSNPQAIPTTSFDTILRDPAVDAVAIATPAPSHYELAKRGLLAGKHVFVEKPMTLHADHAEELVEISESVDRKLMVGHLLEYHPAVDLMKQHVDRGSLGELYYMYCQRLNLGVIRQEENAFWSLAPHDISVILYLFGAEPNHIDASGQSFLQAGIEDTCFATLHFPDGRMANIHVSWLDPNKTRSMVLVGSERMLVFDDMQSQEKVRIFEKSACIAQVDGSSSHVNVHHGDILIPAISSKPPLAIETEHFIDCIRHDTQPRSDGYDGLRVVRILEEVDRRFRMLKPVALRKVA